MKVLSGNPFHRLLTTFVVCFGLLALNGCLGWGDMFAEHRSLGGDYSLAQGETSGYYCFKKGQTGSVTGPLSLIGWNGDYILLLEENHPRSWTIFAVHPGVVIPSDPVSRQQLGQHLANIIKLMSPEQAWKLAGR